MEVTGGGVMMRVAAGMAQRLWANRLRQRSFGWSLLASLDGSYSTLFDSGDKALRVLEVPAATDQVGEVVEEVEVGEATTGTMTRLHHMTTKDAQERVHTARTSLKGGDLARGLPL